MQIQFSQNTAPSPFQIIVPGSLDPNRRNYDEIIQTLPILVSPIPVELVLLGDGSTEAARRDRCPISDPVLSDRISLRTFNGYIPETTYEETLTHAHLIWSPLNIHKNGSRNHPRDLWPDHRQRADSRSAPQ